MVTVHDCVYVRGVDTERARPVSLLSCGQRRARSAHRDSTRRGVDLLAGLGAGLVWWARPLAAD